MLHPCGQARLFGIGIGFLVALCSIGPILSVLLLGFLGNGDGGASGIVRVSLDSTTVIGTAFVRARRALKDIV